MKEVKRLSDEVLLYKSWGESPSGHAIVNIKVIHWPSKSDPPALV